MLSKGQSLRTTVLFTGEHEIKLQSTLSKGGFPLSRIFSARAHVHFTRVNEMETVKGMSRVYVKVEPPSTFTFTCDFSHNDSTVEPLYNSHLGDRRKWPL